VRLSPHRNLFHAIYIVKPQLTKPDDGHVRPKHVVLILTLKNIHPLYNIRVVFLTTLPPI